MDIEKLASVRSRQSGLFTRQDAVRCGFSPYQIRRRVALGEWRTVVGPVLLGSGTPLTVGLRDRAAQLAAAGSMLAGPSAARAWRMPVADSRTVLLVPPPARAVVPGVLVLRCGIDPRDIGEVRGVPSTWRERTVFDCLRLLPERAGLALLDQALVQRWASVQRLTELAHQHVGHHGIGRVREALRVIRGGERSEAERVMTRLLIEAQITGWRANAPITDGRGVIGIGDVVFARRMLVLEVDGWAYHSADDRFQRDRTRQNRLVAAGWTVLRFTWRDLTEHPDRVISVLREVLGQVRVA